MAKGWPPQLERRFNLVRVAETLRALNSRAPDGALQWATECLGKYLAGEATTLDKAFELRPKKRGRPPEPRARELARRAVALHLDGAPTMQGRRAQAGIAEKIDRSPRTVQRYIRKPRQ